MITVLLHLLPPASIDREGDRMLAQTAEVREQHRFDLGALERYLPERVPGFAGPLEVRTSRHFYVAAAHAISPRLGLWPGSPPDRPTPHVGARRPA
jgi:hypothetical protein